MRSHELEAAAPPSHAAANGHLSLPVTVSPANLCSHWQQHAGVASTVIHPDHVASHIKGFSVHQRLSPIYMIHPVVTRAWSGLPRLNRAVVKCVHNCFIQSALYLVISISTINFEWSGSIHALSLLHSNGGHETPFLMIDGTPSDQTLII